MTAKEIAGVTGKDIRTVQRWIKDLSDKMPSVNDKMSLSSPAYPADFNLEETIEIIKEGLGEAAAGVYRVSASNKSNKPVANVTKLADLLPNGKQLEQLGRIMGQAEAAKMIKYLIGYPGFEPAPQTTAIVERKADGFPPELIRYSTLALNVAERARRADEAKRCRDRLQYRLGEN